MKSCACCLVLLLLALSGSGCSQVIDYAVQVQPPGDESIGVTYYLGGAGPIGHVGSFDVPGALRDAGYQGGIRVFSWQSWNHAGDQMNIGRNRAKAAELADEIRRYRRAHPDGEINIIALSAGTGIATFAMEYLPERIRLNNVVFLACSMSARYDLTRALRRISGNLYVVYSPDDIILKDVVWYTGTVDRRHSISGIAGLEGFYLPHEEIPETVRLYREKVVNVPYRRDFAEFGYGGGHIDVVSREFIRMYIATAIQNDDALLVGAAPDDRYAERRPRLDRIPDRAFENVPDRSTLSNSR